jgi:acyl carrier protein
MTGQQPGTESASSARQMIEYLKTRVLRNPTAKIDEDTTLVSSGLVDSFALIDVLLHLEKVTNRKISPGKVSPRDMDTVRQMLATADRVGKPNASK